MKNNKLKELRKKHNLSCLELQEKAGVSGATISRYENEKLEGKISNWKKLADYFGVSFDYLVGWED